MKKLQRAVLFAAKKHQNQLRKGTNIPYIVHPIGVMEMLIHAGASNDAIVAGVLHDTIEDTNTTYDELVKNFGKRVADIVRACSESDKSLPWETRKKTTIDALRKCKDYDILAVAFADKANNIASTTHDYSKYHDSIWSRFKRGQEAQMWYYGELCKIAKERYEQVNLPLRTLMCNYWWEHDNFIRTQERWARLCGCGDDREYTPEKEESCNRRVNELVKQINNKP